MPSPLNIRDLDPDVAPLVSRLKASGKKVENADDVRRAARAARRQLATESFEAGISWRRIAEYGRYGTPQAAQQDVTNNITPGRRSTD
jgi:hypothetical protein